MAKPLDFMGGDALPQVQEELSIFEFHYDPLSLGCWVGSDCDDRGAFRDGWF